MLKNKISKVGIAHPTDYYVAKNLT
ncbi:hypothetical protein CWATWH0003_3864b1, partial [Crocosphaera watsonii WH 0003]